jgi:hypothetical protein
MGGGRRCAEEDAPEERGRGGEGRRGWGQAPAGGGGTLASPYFSRSPLFRSRVGRHGVFFLFPLFFLFCSVSIRNAVTRPGRASAVAVFV